MKLKNSESEVVKSKKHFDIGLLILCLWIGSYFLYATQRESHLQGRYLLSNSWEYLISSTQTQSPQDTSKMTWTPNEGPCIHTHLESSFIWLRVPLPFNLKPSHIIIRSYSAPFEVFIDDSKISQFQNMTNSPETVFYGFTSHRIPMDSSYSGKTLYFRLNNQFTPHPGFCGPDPFQLEEDAYSIVNSHEDGILTSSTAFIGVLFGFFGFGMMLSSVKQFRFYGSFTGLMFALSIWIYSCVSGPIFKWPYHWTPMIWTYLDLMGLYLVPPFLLIFFCSIFAKHSSQKKDQWLIKILIWMYRAYFIHAGGILAFSLLGVSKINATLQWFDQSVPFFFLFMIVNIINVICNRKIPIRDWISFTSYSEIAKIKYFSIGFFVFTITGIHDVLVGLQFESVTSHKHWTYIGAFALISSFFLLLVLDLNKTLNETKYHKAIENTLDRALHDSKTPVTRSVETISSLYTLLPRKTSSLEDLLVFRNICEERFKSAYNIAVQAERNLSDTIKNRKDLEVREVPDRSTASIIELLHKQIQQSLSGYKFFPLEFKYDFKHKSQVFCDIKQIARVLSNLLSNAAKHAEGTPPTILFKTSEQKSSVLVSITNTGTPIPMNEREPIFEKFYTIHQGDSLSQCGHGIGLTIVKTFLEANKGSVRCNPIKDFGTEFAFSIPSSNQKDTADRSYLFGSSSEMPQVASIILSKDAPLSYEENQLQIKIESLLAQRKTKFKICIIDDEDIIRQSIVSYISSTSLEKLVEVIPIEDPIDGITYVLDHSPDLVLIDLVFQIQKRDGFFILDKLKNLNDPFKILYTNNAIRNDELIKHHADLAMDKPMWRVDLFRLIIKTLGRNIKC